MKQCALWSLLFVLAFNLQIVLSQTTCLPSRLVTGESGYVMSGLPNRIRITPSTESTIVNQIPPGDTFTVIDGPECVEGINWWYISYDGGLGWTAEAQSDTYYLAPIYFGSERITAENASRLAPVGVLGRGYHSGLQWSDDGENLIVESEGGVWQYDANNLVAPPQLLIDRPLDLQSQIINYSEDRRLRAVRTSDQILIEELEPQTRIASIPFRAASAADRIMFNNENRLVAIARCSEKDARNHCIASEVLVWDIQQNTQLALLRGHVERISNLTFSPDSSLLISQGHDGLAIVWELHNGTILTEFTNVSVVLFSNDSHTVFYGVENEIHVWDVETQLEAAPWLGHEDTITTMSLSEDGFTLASGDTGFGDQTTPHSSTVRLWNVRTGQQLAVLEHGGTVDEIMFSPSDSMIVSISAQWFDPQNEDTVKLWTVLGSLITSIDNRMWRPAYVVAFDPTETRLALLYVDGALGIYDTHTGSELASRVGNGGRSEVLLFSPDGSMVAAGDSAIRIWDTVTGVQRFTVFSEHEGVAFSPDSSLIATAGNPIRIYGIAGGTLHTTLALEGYISPTRLAFSPDGTKIAAGDYEDEIIIWDVASGLAVATLSDGDIWDIAYSPDGRWIATAGFNRDVKVWNTQDYTLRAILPGGSQGMPSIAFSPDSTILLYSGANHHSEVWDTQTGELLVPFSYEENGGAYDIAFSPDGQVVATAGDQGLFIWETATRTLLTHLDSYDHAQYRPGILAFSPDGFYIATGSGICLCADESYQLEVLRLLGIPQLEQ